MDQFILTVYGYRFKLKYVAIQMLVLLLLTKTVWVKFPYCFSKFFFMSKCCDLSVDRNVYYCLPFEVTGFGHSWLRII